MIVGRYSLAAMVLVMLISMSFVATVIAQEDDKGHATETIRAETESETSEAEDTELPIGVELAARFHEIMEAHKAEILAIIEEFKFNNSQNHLDRLRIIQAYHNQTGLRLEEIRAQKALLLELFNNGTIDRDEFAARMRLLKASLKGFERMVDKLGWQLWEVAKKAAEQHRQKAEMLKDLNEKMREEMKEALQEMKEEMKRHGPPWMTAVTTTQTTTTTST